MAHFAEINSDNNIVLRVIVVGDHQCVAHGGENSIECEQWVKNFHPNDPFIDYSNISNTYWKRTSYWTKNGIHSKNQLKAFRGNYAGINSIYDPTNDLFWPPKLYNSWIKNFSIIDWQAPIAYPSITTYGDNANYSIYWDENGIRWLGKDNQENIFAWSPQTSSWLATGN